MTFNPSDWLVSSWDAGQSSIMTWSKDNVRFNSDGSADFILSEAPAGSSRPYLGGEIQSDQVATTGTWSWVAKVPDMADGAVFGMFLYREDHWNDPWLEYDFEFVGGDTTKVQLAVHMEDADGRHISSIQINNGPHIVDLGFDASERAAHYEVTVTETSATFRIDGKVVGTFDASDMPGGVWYTNPMKSFVDLWAVAPAQEAWAGEWNYPGSPLVATVESYEIRPGEYTSSFDDTPVTPPFDEDGSGDPDDCDGDTKPSAGSIVGTDASDTLNGTSGADVIYGLAGNDTIDGRGGADEMHGGAGDDTLLGGPGDDQLFGGPGDDILRGGGGNDQLHGGRGHDRLFGGPGDDILWGGGGNDLLKGGDGNDRLSGGHGDDILRGGDKNDILSGGDGDDRLFGGTGMDTFVFQPNGGNNTVADFDDGDLLDFSGFGFADEAAVLDLAVQVGANVLFALPDHGSVRLNDYDLVDLGGDDILV